MMKALMFGTRRGEFWCKNLHFIRSFLCTLAPDAVLLLSFSVRVDSSLPIQKRKKKKEVYFF